jgi:hypothetical protein
MLKQWGEINHEASIYIGAFEGYAIGILLEKNMRV